MGRRHMVTVRIHREVMTRGDRLRSMCFMMVSTHLTTAAKDATLTQQAVGLLIFTGEVRVDRVGAMPMDGVGPSVVNNGVQIVKRRCTCNGRHEHCTDIVRAGPLTGCRLE